MRSLLLAVAVFLFAVMGNNVTPHAVGSTLAPHQSARSRNADRWQGKARPQTGFDEQRRLATASSGDPELGTRKLDQEGHLYRRFALPMNSLEGDVIGKGLKNGIERGVHAVEDTQRSHSEGYRPPPGHTDQPGPSHPPAHASGSGQTGTDTTHAEAGSHHGRMNPVPLSPGSATLSSRYRVVDWFHRPGQVFDRSPTATAKSRKSNPFDGLDSDAFDDIGSGVSGAPKTPARRKTGLSLARIKEELPKMIAVPSHGVSNPFERKKPSSAGSKKSGSLMSKKQKHEPNTHPSAKSPFEPYEPDNLINRPGAFSGAPREKSDPLSRVNPVRWKGKSSSDPKPAAPLPKKPTPTLSFSMSFGHIKNKMIWTKKQPAGHLKDAEEKTVSSPEHPHTHRNHDSANSSPHKNTEEHAHHDRESAASGPHKGTEGHSHHENGSAASGPHKATEGHSHHEDESAASDPHKAIEEHHSRMLQTISKVKSGSEQQRYEVLRKLHAQERSPKDQQSFRGNTKRTPFLGSSKSFSGPLTDPRTPSDRSKDYHGANLGIKTPFAGSKHPSVESNHPSGGSKRPSSRLEYQSVGSHAHSPPKSPGGSSRYQSLRPSNPSQHTLSTPFSGQLSQSHRLIGPESARADSSRHSLHPSPLSLPHSPSSEGMPHTPRHNDPSMPNPFRKSPSVHPQQAIDEEHRQLIHDMGNTRKVFPYAKGLDTPRSGGSNRQSNHPKERPQDLHEPPSSPHMKEFPLASSRTEAGPLGLEHGPAKLFEEPGGSARAKKVDPTFDEAKVTAKPHGITEPWTQTAHKPSRPPSKASTSSNEERRQAHNVGEAHDTRMQYLNDHARMKGSFSEHLAPHSPFPKHPGHSGDQPAQWGDDAQSVTVASHSKHEGEAKQERGGKQDGRQESGSTTPQHLQNGSGAIRASGPKVATGGGDGGDPPRPPNGNPFRDPNGSPKRPGDEHHRQGGQDTAQHFPILGQAPSVRHSGIQQTSPFLGSQLGREADENHHAQTSHTQTHAAQANNRGENEITLAPGRPPSRMAHTRQQNGRLNTENGEPGSIRFQAQQIEEPPHHNGRAGNTNREDDHPESRKNQGKRKKDNANPDKDKDKKRGKKKTVPQYIDNFLRSEVGSDFVEDVKNRKSGVKDNRRTSFQSLATDAFNRNRSRKRVNGHNSPSPETSDFDPKTTSPDGGGGDHDQPPRKRRGRRRRPVHHTQKFKYFAGFLGGLGGVTAASIAGKGFVEQANAQNQSATAAKADVIIQQQNANAQTANAQAQTRNAQAQERNANAQQEMARAQTNTAVHNNVQFPNGTAVPTPQGLDRAAAGGAAGSTTSGASSAVNGGTGGLGTGTAPSGGNNGTTGNGAGAPGTPTAPPIVNVSPIINVPPAPQASPPITQNFAPGAAAPSNMITQQPPHRRKRKRSLPPPRPRPPAARPRSSGAPPVVLRRRALHGTLVPRALRMREQAALRRRSTLPVVRRRGQKVRRRRRPPLGLAQSAG